MKRGFTLIELLAVIVILAFIALIVTPVVIGIINDSRNKGNDRSAELYINAVEQALARKNFTTRLINTTCNVKEDGNLDCDGVDVLVEVANTKATSGTIVFEDAKIIKIENLKVGNKYYTLGNNGKLVMSDGKKKCEYVDSNSDGIPSFGELVKCGEESFYIIETDLSSTVMLAVNNISVSSSPKQVSSLSPTMFSQDTYWIEGDDVKSQYPLIASSGLFKFYEVFDNNSSISNYLDKYKKYLESLNYDIGNISLLSNSQAVNLGCKMETVSCLTGPSWVYSIPYWSSVAGNSSIVVINSDGSIGAVNSSNSTDYAIRPVVTILTKNLVSKN